MADDPLADWEPLYLRSRSLPRDLAFAHEFAARILEIAQRAIGVAQLHSLVPKGIGDREEVLGAAYSALTSLIDEYREQMKSRPAFWAVESQFGNVSSQDALFGASSAHSAAVGLANDVWSTAWAAADLNEWNRVFCHPAAELDVALIRPRVAEVCRAVAGHDWPDPLPVIAAMEGEVSRAAARREELAVRAGGSQSCQGSVECWARVRVDVESRAVYVDGELIGDGVHADIIALIGRLVDAGGRSISIRGLPSTDALKGKNWTRALGTVEKSHPRVRRLIDGTRGKGYALHPPPRP